MLRHGAFQFSFHDFLFNFSPIRLYFILSHFVDIYLINILLVKDIFNVKYMLKNSSSRLISS